MKTDNKMRLLVSRSFLETGADLPLAVLDITPWLATKNPVWQGALPLAVLLDSRDNATYGHCALSAVFAPQSVPVILGGSQAGLHDTALKAVLAHLGVLQSENTALRSENASLRSDFMQLQQTFTTTEDFLYAAFAPQFTCVRTWPPTGETSQGGHVRQRLPVGSTGLVAVDIWAMGKGVAKLRFCRDTGADFGPGLALQATGAGWVRTPLPLPLTGLAEDVFIEVKSDFALGLSLRTPVTALHATGANAPLALRVWKGLPGVRLPDMGTDKPRHILPASALPDPEIKTGSVTRLRGREAFSLHPAHDGRLDMVFRGVNVPTPANIALYAQNFGPETVTLTLALADDAPSRDVYLQPETHGQCDLDIATPGPVDLYVKLRSPLAMASVFIRGLEIVEVAG